jgi:hypothetical protein
MKHWQERERERERSAQWQTGSDERSNAVYTDQ